MDTCDCAEAWVLREVLNVEPVLDNVGGWVVRGQDHRWTALCFWFCGKLWVSLDWFLHSASADSPAEAVQKLRGLLKEAELYAEYNLDVA